MKPRKNPWDSNQFKKSNVKGNADAWRNAAQGIRTPALTLDEDMALLNIKELTDLKTLTKARNLAMHQAHPDKGGTDEQARRITDAYNRLKLRLPS